MSWASMLRTAVGLGIQPEAFWRLSLKEWRMLTERAPAPAMGRAAMEGLMARWPDLPTAVIPAAEPGSPHTPESGAIPDRRYAPSGMTGLGEKAG
jgi:uncharacterized phage protein (TIGR02216 family)